MRFTLLISVLVLAGCGEVMTEDGSKLSRGQRQPLHFMCPGVEFDGWRVYDDRGFRFTDLHGHSLNNSSKCAWLVTGPVQQIS